jgi:hypothetical protein
MVCQTLLRVIEEPHDADAWLLHLVAEFLTNITGGALLAAEEGCGLNIVEEYTLAVGAAAGATVAVGEVSSSSGVYPFRHAPRLPHLAVVPLFSTRSLAALAALASLVTLHP